MAADIDVLRRRAEEGLHRTFKPNGLLKRIAGEGRIAAQPRPFLRKAGEAIDGGAEAVDGGIDTRREQRAHQHRCLRLRDIAGIDPGMDAGAETSRCEIVSLALLLHISLVRLRAFDRGLPQFVRRPERIEDHAGVGQQMVAAFLSQPDSIGKDRQRIGLGQIGDGIDASLGQQPVDLDLGGVDEPVTDLLHDRRRKHPAEYRTGPRMGRRVGLENQARRPPRFLLGKIAQAHAAAGTERQGIVEHSMNFRVARDRIYVPFVEMHHRARLAQRLVGGVRVLEEFV